MKGTLYILLLLSFVAVTSCSTIFEDRSKCPSALVLDYSSADERVKSANVWIIGSNGELLHRRDITESSLRLKDIYSVARGETLCYVWANIGSSTLCNMEYSSSAKLINAGSGLADSLYLYRANVVVNRDTLFVRVEPSKMYANIYISYNSFFEGDRVVAKLSSPYGAFALDGTPLMEQLRCERVAHTPKEMLRLLKPADYSGIGIEFTYTPNGGAPIGLKYDLGNWLSSTKYDLGQMKDIYIEIDLSSFSAFITTDKWKIVPDFDILF